MNAGMEPKAKQIEAKQAETRQTEVSQANVRQAETGQKVVRQANVRQAEASPVEGRQTKAERKQQLSGQEPSLKGTMWSVMLLGAFLVVTWFSVWILFISRQ